MNRRSMRPAIPRATRRDARALPLALLCCALAAAGPGSAADTLLRVAGSDSMAPLLRELATAFAERNPGFRLEMTAPGSSTGPPLLLRGEAQLASMTRPMNDLELAAFQAKYGHPPSAVVIAVDAVAVFVSAENPIGQLSLEQLDAIFSHQRRCGAEQPIRVWGDLGLAEPWASRAIGIYVTPHASGTRSYFELTALCGGRIRDGAREQPGARSVVHAIRESIYGIGYGTRAALAPGVKALRMHSGSGPSYAVSSADPVRTGRYPLSRSLRLYSQPRESAPPIAATDAFLRFVLSDAGQQIVESQGFGRLAPERAREQLATLD